MKTGLIVLVTKSMLFQLSDFECFCLTMLEFSVARRVQRCLVLNQCVYAQRWTLVDVFKQDQSEK
jgi:hypothetical protein